MFDFGVIEGEAAVVLLTTFAATAPFDRIAHMFDLAAAMIVFVDIRISRLDNEYVSSAVDGLKFLFVDFAIAIDVNVLARLPPF